MIRGFLASLLAPAQTLADPYGINAALSERKAARPARRRAAGGRIAGEGWK